MSNVGQRDRSALKVGSSGGRSSKTSTVIRTANTPSENALRRSGVLLTCVTAVILFPRRERFDVRPNSEGSAPLPSDRLHLAPLDAKHPAGHPPCRRRYDERHDVRHLPRFTETANAGLLEELLLRFFKCNLPGSRGFFNHGHSASAHHPPTPTPLHLYPLLY